MIFTVVAGLASVAAAITPEAGAKNNEAAPIAAPAKPETLLRGAANGNKEFFGPGL